MKQDKPLETIEQDRQRAKIILSLPVYSRVTLIKGVDIYRYGKYHMTLSAGMHGIKSGNCPTRIKAAINGKVYHIAADHFTCEAIETAERMTKQ